MGQTTALIVYIVHWFTRVAAAAVLVLAAGFLVFIAMVQTQAVPIDPRADGMVVLTGGEGRVPVALELLKQKRAQALLISGVHKGATEAQVGEAQGMNDADSKALFDCCVDLGYLAGSTVGNAEEAAQWARDKQFKSLIIVTANYHAPRARLEFAAAMPDAQLTYYPLARNTETLQKWWQEPVATLRRFPGTMQNMMIEYGKYLFALGRTFVRVAE
jgi:uncharacterized SAM-binding protein YcdF (DUF218 family)